MKTIINYTLCVIFIIFALLQLNDPDGWIWFAIYFVIGAICLIQNFNPLSKYILVIVFLLLLIYAGFHFKLFVDYLLTENKAEIFGEMVYEKPYLEGSREFIGLLLAAGAIFYQMKQRKKVQSQ
ncbi:transmembrane 220 family protein [Aestuariivivens sediminicola]|uniref:transmembrane 220 family protein n=1 Tax=Aestuariivivens sediminicola TaxID=2913560 RepID=UPI001F579684|nr:transmembrane 220 family protein [Aestuariivivens sediminicola]